MQTKPWLAFILGLSLVACDGDTNDGVTDDGVTDDGVTDDGVTDDGVTDDGDTDDGDTDDGDTDQCPATDACLPPDSDPPEECPTPDEGRFACGDLQCNSSTEVCIQQYSAQCPVFACEPLPTGCNDCDCLDILTYCDGALSCSDEGAGSTEFMLINCDG